MRWLRGALVLTVSVPALAATPGPEVAPFVTVDAPVFVLRHVRVIDGTGAPAREDQSVVVAQGRIQALGPAASTRVPDLTCEKPLLTEPNEVSLAYPDWVVR